jgi:beta-glucanase (GH16 family)
MKKLIIFLTFSLLLIEAQSQGPWGDPSHWRMEFRDEFNFLNTAIWSPVHEYDHYSFGLEVDTTLNGDTLSVDTIRSEAQVYTNRSKNVRVENGVLRLEAHKEGFSCQGFGLHDWGCTWQVKTNESYDYTAGEIDSRYKEFEYGYYETRIRISSDWAWLFPAWWFYNKSNNYLDPNNKTYNEIDIFEMIPGMPASCATGINSSVQDRNDMTSNLHSPDYWGGPTSDYCTQHCECGYRERPMNDYTNWHVYGFERTPDWMIWYIDGQEIGRDSTWDLIEPMMMIFNMALKANILEDGEDSLVQPEWMEVDYIIMMTPKADCDQTIDVCTTNLTAATYQSIKKQITIGKTGCSNTLSSGNSSALMAVNFITLDGEFTAELGADFVMEISERCYTGRPYTGAQRGTISGIDLGGGFISIDANGQTSVLSFNSDFTPIVTEYWSLGDEVSNLPKDSTDAIVLINHSIEVSALNTILTNE